MKKTITLAALAMLLCTLFAFSALASGTEDAHTHYATCQNPGVCALCGLEDAALEGQHVYDQKKYHTTDYSHLLICDVCGSHNYDSNESHTATGAWLHNETEHYRTCSVCNAAYDHEAHDIRCTMPGFCYTCGAETALEAQHDMIYILQGKDHHQYKCINCDEMNSEIEACTFSDYIIVDISQHEAVCDVCESGCILKHRYDMSNPTVCLDCGFEKPDSDDSHEHSFNHYTLARDDNNHWQICTVCSFPNSESVTAHKWFILENEATATCTRAGIVVYRCECNLFKSESGGTLGHAWVETARIDATCTEAGSVTRVCRRCYETETKEIPALNHDWQEAENIAPTCTSKGYIMQVCMNCSETTLEEVAALAHDWYESERKEPTATEKGYVITACRNCDETTTQEIPTTEGHDWYKAERVEPTCTEKGYVITACHHCDETTTREIPALGHDWQETESVAPTCTQQGSEKLTCTVCGTFTRKLTDPLGHVFPENSRICAVCGYMDEAADVPAQPDGMEAVIAAFLEKNPQAQVMHLNLQLNDLPLQLNGTIHVSIPLESIGAQSFRLAEIHENGEISDIPYEVVNDAVVFEVNVLGYYALIPV